MRQIAFRQPSTRGIEVFTETKIRLSEGGGLQFGEVTDFLQHMPVQLPEMRRDPERIGVDAPALVRDEQRFRKEFSLMVHGVLLCEKNPRKPFVYGALRGKIF
jgi:hypothetical protein